MWSAIVFFAAFLAHDLHQGRETALEQARRLAISYAHLVAEHAGATFERTDGVLRQAVGVVQPADLRDGLGMMPARRHAIEAELGRLQSGGRGIVSMTVTDANGVVLANTVGTPPGGSLGDRHYFRTLRDGGAEPVISEMIKGRVSNLWGVQVARAIRDSRGRFAGMVVANVGLKEYFEPFYASLSLDPSMLLSLRDFNHRVMVRYPTMESAIGQSYPTPAIDDALAEGLPSGVYDRPSPVDGKPRLLAFHMLANVPAYAVVGVPRDAALREWNRARNRAAIALGGVAVTGMLVTFALWRNRQLEDEVRLGANRLSLALKAAGAGAWQWTTRPRRLAWSPEQAALHGIDRPPAGIEEWLALAAPEDREALRRQLEMLLAGQETTFRLECRDRRGRWLAHMGRLTYDRLGRPTRAEGVSLDVTAAKEAELLLREAKAAADQASQARSRVLAAASHDLRQPVQSLLLLIEVVKGSVAGTPLEKVAEQMEFALDALRILLNSLLDMSKLDAGLVTASPRRVALGELIGRLGAEYAVRAADQKLTLRWVRTGLKANTDPALLERLLRNLIENALRYTPTGGIVLGCRRRGNHVRIDVVDSGIGIAEADQKLIFDEFHQVGNPSRDRAQGLGLGLAIVRRLALLLEAEVSVASVPGRGSRFSVHLKLD